MILSPEENHRRQTLFELQKEAISRIKEDIARGMASSEPEPSDLISWREWKRRKQELIEMAVSKILDIYSQK